MSKASNLRKLAIAMAMGARLAGRARKTAKPVRRTQNMLAALGVGAALMYFFDPDEGRRRRALLRDKVVKMQNDLQDTAQSKTRHWRNKATGMVAEVRGKVQDVQESASGPGRPPQVGAG